MNEASPALGMLGLIMLITVIWFIFRSIPKKTSVKRNDHADMQPSLPTGVHIPRLPTIAGAPRKIFMPSDSNKKVKYQVDLLWWLCACADAKKRREAYGAISTNPLVVCKHMRRAADKVGLEINPMLQALFESEFYSSFRVLYEATIGRTKLLLAAGHEPEWINVFWPEDKGDDTSPYIRFGYSLSEKRWSNEDEPESHVEITELIHRIWSAKP